MNELVLAITLSNTKSVAIVDAQLAAVVDKHNWHLGSYGYACTNVKSRGKHFILKLHRLLMQDKLLPHLQVDHINGDRLDNRLCNLRAVTHGGNKHGYKKSNIWSASKYRGVFWCNKTKQWKAQIGLNGKQNWLGYFKTEHEAALAYNAFRRKRNLPLEGDNVIRPDVNLQGLMEIKL